MTAGFNVNRLKMFIIDDADSILKLRHETKLMRCQTASIKHNVLSSQNDFGRIESLVDKMMVELICLKLKKVKKRMKKRIQNNIK
jgi:hypothetical protein